MKAPHVDDAEIRKHLDKLAKLGGRYRVASRAAVDKVERSQWAKGSRYTLCPLEAERKGEAPGKALAGEPKRKSDVQQDGLDSKGRIVLMRRFDDNEVGSETFFEYGPKGDAVALHFYKKKVVAMYRYDFVDGRVAKCVFGGPQSASRETFSYDRRGRLTAVDDENWELIGKSHTRIRDTIAYGAEGSIRIVRHGPRSAERVVFTNAKRDVPKLAQAFAGQLALEIEQAVLARSTGEPICAVAMAYDDEGLLPSIGVLLERERDAFFEKWRGGQPSTWWNPAEYGDYDRIRLDGPAIRAMEAELVSQSDLRAARVNPEALFVGISKALAGGHLRSEANVTKDFVVFATDFECSRLERNLKAANPAKVVSALKRRKLL